MKRTTLEDMKRDLLGDDDIKFEYDLLQITKVVTIKFLKYRKENMLSQRALAEKLGISLEMVIDVEQYDCSNIPLGTAIRCLMKLGCTLEFNITNEK